MILLSWFGRWCMARLGRPGLSDGRKRELWERWAAGESISEIGRAMGKPPGSVFTVLRSNGGCVPSARRRRAESLSLEEREEISRGLARGDSLRAIGSALARAASTVCREVNRNGGRARYRAAGADEHAWDRARRPKQCLLARLPRLADFVAGKLSDDWSPEQISGHLAKTYDRDSGMRVSHETIYKTLFIQSRGVLARNSQGTSAVDGRSDATSTTQRQANTDRRSKTPCRSGNARPTSRTELSPAIGREICCSDEVSPRSPPSSSVPRGSPYSCSSTRVT
jgi:hypothetical protein